PSALHQTIVSRVRREPAAIARLLAKRYPETPSISYIPAVSWVNTLRLAELTGDASLETKVQNQIAPWVSGERKLFGDRVQRTAGLFNHALDGPAAWGRGNGFAALGLVDVLSALPASHPQRGRLLEIFRRQMAAVRAQQAPDGMWREIVDDPAAYREETATA